MKTAEQGFVVEGLSSCPTSASGPGNGSRLHQFDEARRCQGLLGRAGSRDGTDSFEKHVHRSGILPCHLRLACIPSELHGGAHWACQSRPFPKPSQCSLNSLKIAGEPHSRYGSKAQLAHDLVFRRVNIANIDRVVLTGPELVELFLLYHICLVSNFEAGSGDF